MVYRETSNRWEPKTFVSRNENNVLVKEPDGSIQPYCISKVSELSEVVYLPRPDIYGVSVNDDVDVNVNINSAAEKVHKAEQNSIDTEVAPGATDNILDNELDG